MVSENTLVELALWIWLCGCSVGISTKIQNFPCSCWWRESDWLL